MSNIKNAFGNAGWIQSAIDKSRFKTRPGERSRRIEASTAAKRKATLEADPLYKKYSTPSSPVSLPLRSILRPKGG